MASTTQLRQPTVGRTVLAVLVVILSCVVLGTSVADAHAALLSSDPPNGARLDAAIDEVVLTFNEAVRPRAFTLVDSSGARTELNATGGEVVRVPVDTDQGGWFALSWSVVSADGHPIGGAISFRVGEGTDEVPDELASFGSESGSVGNSWEPVRILGRGLAVMGLVIATGAAFLRRWALTGGIESVRHLGVASALAGVSGAVVAVAVSFAANLVVWPGTAADIVMGASAMAILVWAARTSDKARSAGIAAVLGMAGLAALALSGHVAADGRPGARVALAAHVVAGTVWLGATPALALAVRDGEGWPVLRRFSLSATFATGVVAVGGALATWSIADGVSSITTTTWGRLLSVKVALVVGAGALGAVNRRKVHRETNLTTVRRLVRAEAVLLIAVLVVTAGMARSSPGGVAAPDRGPQVAVVELDELTAELIVDEESGRGRLVHLTFVDEQRQPVDTQAAALKLSAEELGISPIEQDLSQIGPGHYVASTEDLQVAGEWTFHITAQVGRFSSEAGEVKVGL